MIPLASLKSSSNSLNKAFKVSFNGAPGMIYLDSAIPKAGEKALKLKSLLDGLLNWGSANLLLADCANNLGLSTPGICGIQLFGYGGNVCGQSFIMNFENCDIGKGKYEVQGHCLAFRSFSNYPVPANNAWHNLTITYDGTNFRFYGDGVLSSSSANTSLSTFVTSK